MMFSSSKGVDKLKRRLAQIYADYKLILIPRKSALICVLILLFYQTYWISGLRSCIFPFFFLSCPIRKKKGDDVWTATLLCIKLRPGWLRKYSIALMNLIGDVPPPTVIMLSAWLRHTALTMAFGAFSPMYRLLCLSARLP